jgi:virginiamycin A acetyltransferase
MCRIGDHVTIASNVCILSGKNQHSYQQIGVPIEQQPGPYQQITIGDHCWIGHGAIIMANLGKQNVVAAGTVITKDTNDYEIWAGNPARLINHISD